MTRFSAHLGFLWTDLLLIEAIHAAKAAGFHAVECHWPYDVPAGSVARALDETSLPMLGLNTAPGDLSKSEFGLAALPDRREEARAAIDQAIAYGAEIRTQAVHVMAGVTNAETAHDVFLDNLRYACRMAEPYDITILIEPLNQHDVPGYFLADTKQASDVINEIAVPNLKLLFDCYHVESVEGDIENRFRELQPLIGHVQFASIPDRGPPDDGQIDFPSFFAMLDNIGWSRPLGAEYRPVGATDASLGWLADLRYGASK